MLVASLLKQLDDGRHVCFRGPDAELPAGADGSYGTRGAGVLEGAASARVEEGCPHRRAPLEEEGTHTHKPVEETHSKN